MSPLPGLDEVLDRLRDAQRVLCITGAGISADSGLPTYRGIGGLYNDRHTDDGVPIEVALSGEMMAHAPQITWKYLAQIERNCRGAQPNRAHRFMAELQERVSTTVLTQNIDGFHRHAGSRDLIEIHGDLFDLHCVHCDYRVTVDHYAHITDYPPPCPHCLSYLRPAVVLFGEALPSHALHRLQQVFDEGFDVVFSVGTSSVFPYIAQPFVLADEFGALSIEVNPAETVVSEYAHIAWRVGAAQAFARLSDALFG